jgi:UDP-GlcNAc:undecaprenyl-phosphate GlcNAc-1-phosphate transferase
MDIPLREVHKQHLKPIPLAGGIILFITFLTLSLVEGFTFQSSFLDFLLPFSIILIFGIWDDFVGLKPIIKLVGQLLAASLLILNGSSVLLFSNPFANFLISVFWLVGITNAFNFIDSMDGLAVGLATLSAACLMLVTLQSGQFLLTSMSAIVMGSCIVIFFFNSLPAHYFLGDSGAQFLGFFLAAIAMVYAPVGFTPLTSWFVPILLVGVPIFDTVLVVVSRLRRKVPIYRGNLDHTYHRLVRLGLCPNRAMLSMHTSAIFLDCIAFILLNTSPIVANGAILVLAILSVVLIFFFEHPHFLENNPSPII